MEFRMEKAAKEITFLLGISIFLAFTVNFFSPSGIAIVGQWDDSKGVITAKAKDNILIDELEIDDVKIAKQIFDSGKAVFIDARSLDNFEGGHIKGAVSIPVGLFDEVIDVFKGQYPRDSIIVTYCSGRTCDDSHHLAQLLFEHGYLNVSVFIDGYPDWEAEGYPIE
jgi:rhodanese-related sulfurtransferase